MGDTNKSITRHGIEAHLILSRINDAHLETWPDMVALAHAHAATAVAEEIAATRQETGANLATIATQLVKISAQLVKINQALAPMAHAAAGDGRGPNYEQR